MLMEQVNERFVYLQRWLATSKHDEAGRISTDVSYNLFCRHLAIRIKLRVTERTAQVTARKTDKDGRPTGIVSLAL